MTEILKSKLGGSVDFGGEAVLETIKRYGLYSGDLDNVVLSHSSKDSVFLVEKEVLANALSMLDEEYIKEFLLYDCSNGGKNEISSDEEAFHLYWDGISFKVISEYASVSGVKYFHYLVYEIYVFLREKRSVK